MVLARPWSSGGPLTAQVRSALLLIVAGVCVQLMQRTGRFLKTASGVKLQELALGSGSEAARGCRVLLDYVIRCALLTGRLLVPDSAAEGPALLHRRSNGYFIYSSVQGVSFQPRSVPTEPLSFCLVRLSFVCCMCTQAERS